MKNKPQSQGSGIRLSYPAIAAFVGLLSIAGVIWKVGAEIATKSDIESIKVTITPIIDKHEERIRTLELEMARYFGASQTSYKPSNDTDDAEPGEAQFVLAKFTAAQSGASPNTPLAEQRRQLEAPRRVVVPDEMILMYGLQPSHGGVYSVLGEDGKLYALDDVLAVIIKMHMQEQLQRRSAPVRK